MDLTGNYRYFTGLRIKIPVEKSVAGRAYRFLFCLTGFKNKGKEKEKQEKWRERESQPATLIMCLGSVDERPVTDANAFSSLAIFFEVINTEWYNIGGRKAVVNTDKLNSRAFRFFLSSCSSVCIATVADRLVIMKKQKSLFAEMARKVFRRLRRRQSEGGVREKQNATEIGKKGLLFTFIFGKHRFSYS